MNKTIRLSSAVAAIIIAAVFVSCILPVRAQNVTVPAPQVSPQDDSAKRLDEDLKQTNFCTTQQWIEYNTPGIKLICDSMMTGGSKLETRTVLWIGQCAIYCRKLDKCVAISYDGRDPEGERTHTCILFGGDPYPDKATGWISATRNR
jgi:hypothetical protein